ncbi:MAG TPA: hypothetical protein VK004_05955, partial [Ignavibacteria bacterium]|nr:hypothetical protein [Ignavibacteria bacterium]
MKVPNYLSRLTASPRKDILLAFSSMLRSVASRLFYAEGTGTWVCNRKQKENFSQMKALKTFVLLLTVIIFPAAVFAGYGVNGSNSYLAGLGTPDDYVLVQHDPELSQGADASIEAWVYITDMSSLNYIIAKGTQMGTS